MTILQTQIKKRILDKNLSVRALETRAGVSFGVIQKILTGERKNPGAKTLSAISQALGCSIDDLLTGLHSEPPSSPDSKPQHPWNAQLYRDAQKSVEDYSTKQNRRFSAEKMVEIIWAVYTFSLSKNPPCVDPLFVDWLFTRD